MSADSQYVIDWVHTRSENPLFKQGPEYSYTMMNLTKHIDHKNR
jgi:hypothetical protein